MQHSVCWKLLVSHLVKEFPSFYGKRKFIAAFKRVRHFCLSWARWIQFTPSLPISALCAKCIKLTFNGAGMFVCLSVCLSKQWNLMHCSILYFVLILLQSEAPGKLSTFRRSLVFRTSITSDWLTFWTHFGQLSPDPYSAVKASPYFLTKSP